MRNGVLACRFSSEFITAVVVIKKNLLRCIYFLFLQLRTRVIVVFSMLAHG